MIEHPEKDDSLARNGAVDSSLASPAGQYLLGYSIPRRIPVPVDAIYRVMPHFVRLEVHGGTEYLPKTGNAIFAFKHLGFFDQYFVKQLVRHVTGRWEDVFSFAWAGDFPGKTGLRWWLRTIVFRFLFVVCNYGHPIFAIRQQTWKEDLKKRLARHDQVILIHSPEGRSSPQMVEAKHGTGVLQHFLEVPVIPVAVWGLSAEPVGPARSARLFPAIFVEWLRCFPILRHLPNPYLPKEPETAHILIGPPIAPLPDSERPADRKKLYQLYSDRVVLEIASMMPPEYRGFYKDKLDRPSDAAK